MLQVGHLERFNAAILALEGTLGTPRFIESHRLAPFKERGTDVNVVLDLMIHDIDLIQSLVGAPIVSIDAVGASVFSDGLDIANARIRYANGCVANTTASRVSMKMERKLRLFQDDAYVSIDLQQKILTVVRKPPAGSDMPRGQVVIEERSYEQGDALRFEIEAFLASIREGEPPGRDRRGRPACARDRDAHHARWCTRARGRERGVTTRAGTSRRAITIEEPAARRHAARAALCHGISRGRRRGRSRRCRAIATSSTASRGCRAALAGAGIPELGTTIFGRDACTCR